MKTVLFIATTAVLLARATECDAQLRLVIGLRHNINNRNQPFKPAADANLKRFFVLDAAAGPDMGFGWYMQTGPMAEVGYDKLPPGIVLGLKHSVYQKKVAIEVLGKDVIEDKAPDGLVHKFGGDMGAPRGEGFHWYESANVDFDWDQLKKKVASLPAATIIALRHTEHTRKPHIRWKIDGKEYVLDPTKHDADVQKALASVGIKRNSGGDRGPSKPAQGLYWFEKE